MYTPSPPPKIEGGGRHTPHPPAIYAPADVRSITAMHDRHYAIILVPDSYTCAVPNNLAWPGVARSAAPVVPILSRTIVYVYISARVLYI